jgi:oligopeptidase B
VRELHGERFEDPWFWLRERDDPEVVAYLEAENAWAEAWMAPLAGLRERLQVELRGRLIEDHSTAPYPKGGWLHYSRAEKGRQHRIHCRRRAPDGPEQVLLDLNELGRDEKFVDLGGFEVADDGTKLAYLVDVTGFREYVLRVRDLVPLDANAPPADLPLQVPRVTSVAWGADGVTLLYTVEDAAKRSYRVYRRRLDDDEATLVREEEDERFRLHVERSRSGDWIFLVARSHTATEIRLLDARAPAGEPAVVEPREPGHEYHVDHAGDRLYVRSNSAGRNFALFEAPLAAPGRASWRLLRAHDPVAMLERVDAFAGHLVLSERAAGLPRFRVLALDGSADRVIAMPEPAYAASAGPNEEPDATTFRFGYQSLTTPPSVFDHDVASGRTALVQRDEVPGYDPERYESERIEATAADGTRVPVSLVRARGAARDGTRPALLRGYGAYGFPYPVGFDSGAVSLLDRGFTLALAHVRGGGDLGKPWHDRGRMAEKANTFSDFVACAEELVRSGEAAPGRLALAGGSAGGLLVGAVVNARPELFGAALAYVPFVDVVNSMSDPTLPLTVGEYEEWGDPAIAEQHAWMRAYSPYENLEAKAYPPMLVRTSFWDSQVMYWEPAKYVARLRALKTDANPLLLVTNLDAGGHGGFAGRYDRLRDLAFDYAFLLRALGVE